MTIIKFVAGAWLLIDAISIAVMLHAMKHAPFMDDNGRIIPDDEVVIDLRDNVIDLRDDKRDREAVNA